MRKKILFTFIISAIAALTTFAQQDIHPLPNKLQRCRVENGETVVLVRLKDAVCLAPKGAAKKAAILKKQKIQNKTLAKNGLKSDSQNL